MLVLPPILSKLLPILEIVGIDPGPLAKKFGRDQSLKRIANNWQAIIKRLEKDKLTPAAKAVNPEGEIIFIRAAMYNIAKAVTKVLPVGANLAADFLRDQHFNAVNTLVAAQITAETPLEKALELIRDEFVDHIF